MARAGRVAEAREAAARSLKSFWHAAGRYADQTELLRKALEAAMKLDDTLAWLTDDWKVST
ncbi:hypothetical protein [Nonomuraea sp. B5E05]|uniref:hypothetical protein n=1 Tax=Nonomuraea sp. B5E05 TaxID=3153569 RepID=UPI00326047A8